LCEADAAIVVSTIYAAVRSLLPRDALVSDDAATNEEAEHRWSSRGFHSTAAVALVPDTSVVDRNRQDRFTPTTLPQPQRSQRVTAIFMEQPAAATQLPTM